MSGAVDTELMREPGLEPMVQAPNESGHRRTHHETAEAPANRINWTVVPSRAPAFEETVKKSLSPMT